MAVQKFRHNPARSIDHTAHARCPQRRVESGRKAAQRTRTAQRCHIHANTVSAAYRDLEAKGWLDSKKGSGVYVRALRASPTIEESQSLDELIERFLESVRARGFSLADVRARFTHWLDAVPVSRLVVVEPEPELCEILVAELRERLSVPVTGQILDSNLAAVELVGAAVTALVSRAPILRATFSPRIPHLFLRLRSVPDYLERQERPRPDALIGVASASPEILRRARIILAAAALDADALEFRDAREDDYLTYHRWATARQVEICYPQFRDFLARKLLYDPGEVFQSDWYVHHQRALS
jgi:DNA-binding transcriptional regulator YhcF (GntR family)